MKSELTLTLKPVPSTIRFCSVSTPSVLLPCLGSFLVQDGQSSISSMSHLSSCVQSPPQYDSILPLLLPCSGFLLQLTRSVYLASPNPAPLQHSTSQHFLLKEFSSSQPPPASSPALFTSPALSLCQGQRRLIPSMRLLHPPRPQRCPLPLG